MWPATAESSPNFADLAGIRWSYGSAKLRTRPNSSACCRLSCQGKRCDRSDGATGLGSDCRHVYRDQPSIPQDERLHIIVFSDRDCMMPSSANDAPPSRHQDVPSTCALQQPLAGAMHLHAGPSDRPACVNVSSRRRARGNSLPAAVSARHSRVAVAGSEVGADLDQLGFARRVPSEEVDLVALGSLRVGTRCISSRSATLRACAPLTGLLPTRDSGRPFPSTAGVHQFRGETVDWLG